MSRRPIIAHLKTPVHGTYLLKGRLAVEGWVFFEQPLHEATLLINNQPTASAKLLADRPDVVRAHPDHTGRACDFRVELDTQPHREQSVTLSLQFKDIAGNQHTLKPVRVTFGDSAKPSFRHFALSNPSRTGNVFTMRSDYRRLIRSGMLGPSTLPATLRPIRRVPMRMATDAERADWQRRQAQLAFKPVISVVADNPSPVTQRSLIEQCYDHCQIVPRLASATGEFVCFVRSDDALAPHALLRVAEALAQHPDADCVYSDENQLDSEGRLLDPFHKPDWSPVLLLSQPYVLRLGVYRRSLVSPAEITDDHWQYRMAIDLATRARRVVHIPEILYHRREGVPEPLQRVSYAPKQNEPVTIIIPTRDQLQSLRTCVQSILRRTSYPHFQVLIVNNGSSDPAALSQLQLWSGHPRVRVLNDPSPFNFSALNNRAVRACASPLLLFLNNDTEVINRDWLTEMVGLIEQPGVGAVGAKLSYPDDTIQHVGIILGVGGVASHSHKRFARHTAGYHGLSACVREVSAVTGACLLTRRTVFERVGGFEEQLGFAFNDVDYCLRLLESGHRILVTPFAELYHYEAVSRGDDLRGHARFETEITWMQQRWGKQLEQDRYYNPNLSLHATDYRLRETR